MAHLKLKKLLSDKYLFARALVAALPMHSTVQDASGAWIVGSAGEGAGCAIELSGETLGWVFGEDAAQVAGLISAIAAKEAEKIALADEVLEKYREINLLYHLGEKLAATVELAQVAHIALSESARLVRANAGEMIVRDETGAAQQVAAFGAFPRDTNETGARIAAKALETGKGEIVIESNGSFVVAPLKSQDRVIGAILLANAPGAAFIAADLKLLTTVASQAALPIEHAARYEQAVREARLREDRLQKQIETLQIQVDEARTAKQVAEITETDYFQMLRKKAGELRHRNQ